MTLNPSNLTLCVSFMARTVSFCIVLKRGGKTEYPRFCISLSAFLVNFLFLGKLNGASTAMSVGLHFIVLLTISLSLKRWQAETTLPFNVAHPVGFSGVPARSTPAMMGACVFKACSCVEC